MPDEFASYFIPFTAKGDDSQRIVEGYVSSPAVDCDEQIVDQNWLKAELPGWMLRYGNIREQHNPQRAVGRAQTVDLQAQPGPYLAAKIVDDEAWRKVQAGVYNGFSVGIKAPKIVYDGTAKHGRIAGGTLIEISIVDRPANEAAKFVVLKRAGARAWKLGDGGPVVEDTAPATADEAGCAVAGCGCLCLPAAADPGCTCACDYCAGMRGSGMNKEKRMTDQEPPAAPRLPETVPGGEKASADDATAIQADTAAPPPAVASHPLVVPFQDAAPATVDRPARMGEVMAILKDVQARLEALAGETDKDRDGDIDTPANMEPAGQGGVERPAPDFGETQGTPQVASAPPLSLTFATEADLAKYIDTRVGTLLSEQAQTEFLTKSVAAAAEPLAAIPEIAKLAGGIARGLEALADRTKATAEDLGTTKAALATTQADLARVKELAQPARGAVFAIEKGIGVEPDRIYRDGVVPESAKRGAEAARVLAGLSDEERRQVGAAVLSEMYRAQRG